MNKKLDRRLRDIERGLRMLRNLMYDKGGRCYCNPGALSSEVRLITEGEHYKCRFCREEEAEARNAGFACASDWKLHNKLAHESDRGEGEAKKETGQ